MRFLLLVLAAAVVLAPVAVADNPADPTFDETRNFGEGVSDAELVSISTLFEKPDEFVGKNVKVAGRVIGVCAKRGCWMEIAGDEEFQSMRIKVEDGVIVFPMEAMGHMAVAEGTFSKINLSLDQTKMMEKHRCEEAGEEYDEAKVCTPATLYQIAGVGAEIR